MTYRDKRESIYRMSFLRVWATYLPVKTQTVRELQIQISKLDKLCSVDEFVFLDRFESLKRAKKMAGRHDQRINPQYQTVLACVEKVAQDVAVHKGEGPLTSARLRERVYGAGGFVRQAEDYAKQHCSN